MESWRAGAPRGKVWSILCRSLRILQRAASAARGRRAPTCFQDGCKAVPGGTLLAGPYELLPGRRLPRRQQQRRRQRCRTRGWRRGHEGGRRGKGSEAPLVQAPPPPPQPQPGPRRDPQGEPQGRLENHTCAPAGPQASDPLPPFSLPLCSAPGRGPRSDRGRGTAPAAAAGTTRPATAQVGARRERSWQPRDRFHPVHLPRQMPDAGAPPHGHASARGNGTGSASGRGR